VRRGNDRSLLSSIGVIAVGEVITLAVGATWLATDLHLDSAKAIAFGVTPFLVWDLIKLVAAAAVLPNVWKLVRHG
jgi:biotin transport system substrate-specific component